MIVETKHPSNAHVCRSAPTTDVAVATVPLKRAVVEEMLVQRLADRLHSLSDSQLAAILEQVLQDDASRFPSELLNPAPPALAAPQPGEGSRAGPTAPLPPAPQQPVDGLAPLTAREQEPGTPPAAGAARKSQAVGDLAGFGGGYPSGSEDVSTAPDGDVDLTADLLQQFQRQLLERGGGSGAGSDRGGGSMARMLASNWRLALLAVAGPAVLIISLSRLSGGDRKQDTQQPSAEQPPANAEAQQPPPQQQQQEAQPAVQQGQALPAARQPGTAFSLLPWLFPRDQGPAQQNDGGPPAPSAPLEPVGPVANSAATAPDSPAPAPTPPPLPPGVNFQQTSSSSALSNTGVPPGTILWQRKEAAPDQQATGGGAAVLWRRAEPDSPPAREAGLQPQQGTQQEPASAMQTAASTLANSASGGSASRPVDLWRVPLDQLRSGGTSVAMEPTKAAPRADGNLGHGLAAELPPLAAPGEPSSGEPIGQTEKHASLARNGSAPSPAAFAPTLSRRQSNAAPATALDNAEPAGWQGTLQSMRGRTGAGLRVGGRQDGE